MTFFLWPPHSVYYYAALLYKLRLPTSALKKRTQVASFRATLIRKAFSFCVSTTQKSRKEPPLPNHTLLERSTSLDRLCAMTQTYNFLYQSPFSWKISKFFCTIITIHQRRPNSRVVVTHTKKTREKCPLPSLPLFTNQPSLSLGDFDMFHDLTSLSFSKSVCFFSLLYTHSILSSIWKQILKKHCHDWRKTRESDAKWLKREGNQVAIITTTLNYQNMKIHRAAQGYILYECLWINVVFHDIRKYTITAIFCPIYLQKQSHARGGFYFDVLIHTVRFSLSLWNLYRTLFCVRDPQNFAKLPDGNLGNLKKCHIS